MNTALATTVLLMGLAGSPHCATMCGAACAGVVKRCGGTSTGAAITALHFGRVVSYALAGAVVAASANALAAWSQELRWLQPFWGMLHLAAIALGLTLLWTGQQPGWMAAWGQGASRVVTSAASAPTSALLATRVVTPTTVSFYRSGPAKASLWGLAWAAWPCGLLQSALLVAALASTPAEGASLMTLFALGSALGLWFAPWVWLRIQNTKGWRNVSPRLAIRLAGALLAGASGWALSHGLWSGSCRAFC
ncbi:MAG: sulfite exporter TauE/SafE family protein [Rhizobacter sp.]